MTHVPLYGTTNMSFVMSGISLAPIDRGREIVKQAMLMRRASMRVQGGGNNGMLMIIIAVVALIVVALLVYFLFLNR
jgi:hypothetical protein